MMWGYGWTYWFGMSVTMVLFWGLVIVGIAALIRFFGDARHTGRVTPVSGQARPEQMLAERFARGEIDDDEYRRRLELLRTSR